MPERTTTRRVRPRVRGEWVDGAPSHGIGDVPLGGADPGIGDVPLGGNADSGIGRQGIGTTTETFTREKSVVLRERPRSPSGGGPLRPANGRND